MGGDGVEKLGGDHAVEDAVGLLGVAAVDAGEALPDEYHRLYRIWFIAGFPAFACILIILWLMVARPVGLFG